MRITTSDSWIATLLAVFMLLALPGTAQTEVDLQFHEYQVKAAFLYNFAKFVEWPQGTLGKAGDPIVIGVLGENPFGSDLELVIRNKTAQDRPILIKRFSSTDEVRGCHVLFISESEERRLAVVLKQISKMPILTISDIEGFSKQGGMVTLVTEEDRVRFDVNLDAAQEAGLKISSQLLKLATIIKTGY